MIKKKSNFIILFGLLFSIFLFPKDVFADTSGNYSCLTPDDGNDNSVCLPPEPSKEILNSAEKEGINFLYVTINNTRYKAYFFTGTIGGVGFKDPDFSSLSMSLTVPGFHGSFINKGYYDMVFSDKDYGSSGFFTYDDIAKQLPYYQLYYSGGIYKYTLIFTYTDDVLVTFDDRDSSTPFTVAVPVGDSSTGDLLAMPFVSLYIDEENDVILFGLASHMNIDDSYNWPTYYYTGAFQPNVAGILGPSTYKVNDKYYVSVNLPRWGFADTSHPALDYPVIYTKDNFQNILDNDFQFTSNSNLVDSDGNSVDYNYKQDISNNSSSNPVSGFEVPTTLSEVLAMIPKLLSQMVSAFAVVATIFTTAMVGFPPIITVGLYSVFILGILILIIKCLK